MKPTLRVALLLLCGWGAGQLARAADGAAAPETVTAKTFVLEIRFGTTSREFPSARPSAEFLAAAKKIDVPVTAKDQGQTEAAGGELRYKIDQISNGFAAQISLTIAQRDAANPDISSKHTVDTRVKLDREWTVLENRRLVVGGDEPRYWYVVARIHPMASRPIELLRGR
jgi:hypothetical protein